MDRSEAFMAAVLQEAMAPQPGLWWLSFVDPEIAAGIPLEQQRPGGPSFLGACVVYAEGPMMAVSLSHLQGINPGGEVKMYGPYPPEMLDVQYRNRLLSYEEIEALPEPSDAGT